MWDPKERNQTQKKRSDSRFPEPVVGVGGIGERWSEVNFQFRVMGTWGGVHGLAG